MHSNRALPIIPARNEAPRLGAIIEAVQAADSRVVNTDRIVVVDNNSADSTTEVARACGAQVVACQKVGKGYAMQAGVQAAQEILGGSLLFLDADLHGLSGAAVTKLAEPVVHGEALMNIGFLGGRTVPAKHVLRKWGAFSGQRAVDWRVWNALQPADLQGWRIEGAMNAACRNAGLGHLIVRTELEGVTHTGKREKEPTLRAAAATYGKTYLSALRGVLSTTHVIE